MPKQGLFIPADFLADDTLVVCEGPTDTAAMLDLGLTQSGARAFATLAGRLDVRDRILKAYLGHSSGDVLGGHYRRIGLDELRSVSDAMNGWRAVNLRKHSGNIPVSGIAEG